ncbi:MAG: ATP-dependent DNA helicase RecG [Firmicutes bacterium]|nr:ATP-dependent DNA helicase RecG [Bacillota bacterium]
MSGIFVDELKQMEVTQVKGIGPARARVLAKLGIVSLYDLLFFYPREYEDAGTTALISKLIPGEKYLVCGRVVRLVENRSRTRRNLIITKAILKDRSGELGLIWFQQRLPIPTPIYQLLEKNREICVFGRVEQERDFLLMKNPEVEPRSTQNSLNLGRITPIYPLTSGLNQKTLRRVIKTALDEIGGRLVDPLPAEVRAVEGLPDLTTALHELHFPSGTCGAQKARERLAFEQLLYYALALHQRQSEAAANGVQHTPPGALIAAFLQRLPFTPTGAQQRAAEQIWARMAEPKQMQHLLMGDVGSGKTLVAALAILKTIEDGHQAAFMAPTSILAEQHYRNLSRLLAGFPVQIRLLLGDLPEQEKLEIYAALASGECNLVVGTHALIQEAVRFADLGLAVTDEQHRFGVEQRQLLSSKGFAPDVLILSATPIPRTLALAAYGELGYSILDELPPGRSRVITKWVNSDRLSRVWEFVKREVAAGYRGYVVCPLIEANRDLPGVYGVLEFAAELKERILPELAIGILHGGMSEADKSAILSRFRDGQVQLLVATTVVEIGLDVPEASFMIIMNADRFGLAQLHQLRGRVGRGKRQSYCILHADNPTPAAIERLQTLEQIHEGSRIAEVDLRMRGPGEVFGLRQHGAQDLIFQTMLKHPEVYERAFARAARLAAMNWRELYEPLARQVDREFAAKIMQGEWLS